MNQKTMLFALTSVLSIAACGDHADGIVTVETLANRTYVFHDSTGKEIANQTTVKAGEITQVVPSDSMVTSFSVEANDGSVVANTIMGVNPGDRLVMEKAESTFVTRNVKLPPGFVGSDTKVTVWCENEKYSSYVGSTVPQIDTVAVDVPCIKASISAKTPAAMPATPPKVLFKADVSVDASGMFDVSTAPLRSMKEIAITYTSLPAGIDLGSLSASTVTGPVSLEVDGEEQELLIGPLSNGILKRNVVDLGADGSVSSRLDLILGKLETSPMQFVITGHKSAGHSIDGKVMLPWLKTRTASVADRKLSWTTTEGGKGNPNAVNVSVTVTRGTKNIQWNILAPYTGAELLLPQLTDQSPLHIAGTDSVEFEDLALISVSTGYDSIKSNADAKLTQIISAGGQVVVSQLGDN